MTYKKIYMTFNIKRHMHARVIFRCSPDRKLLSSVISDLGPEHKYAPIAYRFNPFSQDHKDRQFEL